LRIIFIYARDIYARDGISTNTFCYKA